MSAASSLLRRAAPAYLAVGSCATVAAKGSAHARAKSSSAPAAVTAVRVASYNVLSDSLCRASHYTHSAPEDLDNDARLMRVQAKIKEEMDKGSVICLQEVMLLHGEAAIKTLCSQWLLPARARACRH